MLGVTGYVPAAQSSGTVYVSVSTISPSLAAVPAPIASANANSLVASLATSVSPYASEPLAETYTIGSAALIFNCAPAMLSPTALGSFTTMLSVTVSPGSASTVSICHMIAPAGSVTVVVVDVETGAVVVVVDTGAVVVVVVSATVVEVVDTGAVVDVVDTGAVVVVVVSATVVEVVDTGAVVVVVDGVIIMIAPSTRFTLPVMLLPFVSVMNASDHSTGYLPAGQSAGTL